MEEKQGVFVFIFNFVFIFITVEGKSERETQEDLLSSSAVASFPLLVLRGGRPSLSRPPRTPSPIPNGTRSTFRLTDFFPLFFPPVPSLRVSPSRRPAPPSNIEFSDATRVRQTRTPNDSGPDRREKKVTLPVAGPRGAPSAPRPRVASRYQLPCDLYTKNEKRGGKVTRARFHALRNVRARPQKPALLF